MQRVLFPMSALVVGLAASITPVVKAETSDVRVTVAPASHADPMETAEASKAAYEKRQICRQEIVLGSRIPRTVCMTQSQMDARRSATQQWKEAYDQQRDRLPGGVGNTGG